MATTGIGIIGCGRVAEHHCDAIKRADHLSLIAVCDLVEERQSGMAGAFGCAGYANYHEMLRNEPDISLVAIITPSGAHSEHAMDVIEQHGKSVIVEKPTFLIPEQVAAAYQAAREKSADVFPVFQNRYNKAVRRVKIAIEQGELGEVRIISLRLRWCRPQRYYDLAPWRGTFSHDGGALTNQGIHHVDLLRHLGGELDSVNATMRTLGAEIEVEDTVVATMRFANGAVGNLEVTTAARPDDFEASLSIVGSEGLAQIGGVAVNELQIFTPAPEECEAHSEDFSGLEGRGKVYGYGHRSLYEDIAAYMHQDTPFPVSEKDCWSTLKLLHSFYRSDEIGDWVGVFDNGASSRLGRRNDALAAMYRTERPATDA